MIERAETVKRAPVARFFTDHPHSVNETYFEHMRFALRFSGRLLAAGGAAFVHAIFPALFEKTASQLINRMHADMQSRFK